MNDYHEIISHAYFKGINKKDIAIKTSEPLKKFYKLNPSKTVLIQVSIQIPSSRDKIGPSTTPIFSTTNTADNYNDLNLKSSIIYYNFIIKRVGMSRIEQTKQNNNLMSQI